MFAFPFCLLLRNRTRIVVKGLALSGPHLSPDQLRGRLASILQLIGAPISFSVISVATYPSGASPVYDVELDSAAAVSAILREFYKFTRRQAPVSRPPELAHVAVYNSVTPGTRVRISLLRVSFSLL